MNSQTGVVAQISNLIRMMKALALLIFQVTGNLYDTDRLQLLPGVAIIRIVREYSGGKSGYT